MGRVPDIPMLTADRGRLRTAVVRGALDLNTRAIDAYHPPRPGPMATPDVPWVAALTEAWDAIRSEAEALMAERNSVPSIEEITGATQANEGPWGNYVFRAYGGWVEANCARCPATAAAVRQIPGLQLAAFSVLGPGTHLVAHRGPNKGALRYLVGVHIPGSPGQVRFRVGDEMITWADRKAVLFDHTIEHEAWNDSDGERWVLFTEFRWPLPIGLRQLNGMCQSMYERSATGLLERAEEVASGAS